MKMLKIIKNLMKRFKTKQEMDAVNFSKIYGAYAEIIRVSWEQMMKQLEEEGREAERKQILKEIEEIRIYGGSVIPKMAKQVLKYKQSCSLENERE